MGSVDDISQLCRLCLVKDQVNIPIFDEASDIGQTFLKIDACLPVKVSRDDNLPKKICDGCSYKLDMLYTFRNTSIDSEKQLISWLDQAGLSTISQSSVKDPLASTTKPEVMVKQETFETDRIDGDNSEMGVDAESYMQEQLGYEQEFVDFGEASSSNAAEDEPAPKRAKRAAAMKKAPLDDETEEDLDAAMQITKAEEEDSEDVDQPDYVEAPSTSADDQPGPSGVGKAATEAPPLVPIVKLEVDEDGDIQTNAHATEKWLCRHCNKVFLTCIGLHAHCVQEHSLSKSMCPLCSDEFSATVDLWRHFRSHTKPKRWYCEVCDKDLKCRGSLNKHRRHHIQKPGLMCCGRLFNSEARLQSHVDNCHRTDFMCEICGQTFKSKETYITHKNLHDGVYVRRYKCKICDKRFRGSYGLRYHVESVHENRRYPCDICQKVFNSEPKLQEHVKLHTGEKAYLCNICGKSFARSGTLDDHMRVHTKEKPFICKLCNKGFSQRSSMNLHIRGVHKEEQLYDCVICGKRFINSSSLDLHMKLHPISATIAADYDPLRLGWSEVDRMRQQFNAKIALLMLEKASNTGFLPRERYLELINEMKQLKLKKTGKTPGDYHKLKRYDVVKVGGEDKLIYPGNENFLVRYYVANDELFDIIHETHVSLGHGGRNKMTKEINKKFRNVTQEAVVLYLNLCGVCQKRFNVTKKIAKPMIFSRCQVEVIDMQTRQARDFKFILVYQDCSTKFVQLRPLKTNTAEEIADKLLDIFTIFGAPCIIQSDVGYQFVNAIIEKLLGIWLELKLVYGKSNQDENLSSVVENLLCKWLQDHQTTNWSLNLRFVQLVMNRTYQDARKCSAFEAMFGHPVKIGLTVSHVPLEHLKLIKTEEDLEFFL